LPRLPRWRQRGRAAAVFARACACQPLDPPPPVYRTRTQQRRVVNGASILYTFLKRGLGAIDL